MSSPTVVRTQSEFDAAASRGDDWIRSCTVVREVTFSGAPLPATTETAAS